MTQTNPPSKKPSGTHNLKLLFTTLSLTSTLSGWALLSLNQAEALNKPSQGDQPVADLQVATPIAVPTDPPAKVLVIPDLSSLPVRGLKDVGEPVQQQAPQIAVALPQQHQGGGGGGQSRPAPAPKPPPVTHSGGSH